MSDILITTTSILQGYEIKKYLGLVTARLTTGTDMFTDFFASITDVVGGKSKAYEKQLTKLNIDCIDMIKKEAQKLNGNAVMGVTIDYDEITGKGKQMFLITITGTAVIVKSDIENILYDIIDEQNAVGQVRDLEIRKFKINRLLREIDNEDYTCLDEKMLFDYYKISGAYSKAENILYKSLENINKYDIDTYKQVLNEGINLYEISGAYDKSEDILYKLLESIDKKDIEMYRYTINEGIKFYEDLLNKNDKELKKGNLPRNEVIDGLNELKKKLT
ncbi:MAG TPA: DUF6483 family protein [Candidatus Paceibacterota bacterium]